MLATDSFLVSPLTPLAPLVKLCITRIFLNIWESDRSGAIKPPFLHDQFSINSLFYQEE